MIRVTPPTNIRELESFQGKIDRFSNGISQSKPSIFAIVAGAVGLGVVKKINNQREIKPNPPVVRVSLPFAETSENVKFATPNSGMSVVPIATIKITRDGPIDLPEIN